MEEAVRQKIEQLQALEESLHAYLSQKQQAQGQLMELESAQGAIKDAQKAYRIIGSVMVEKPGEEVRKELADRMERIKVRIEALEKQESRLKEKAEKLQQGIMESMKGESHGNV